MVYLLSIPPFFSEQNSLIMPHTEIDHVVTDHFVDRSCSHAVRQCVRSQRAGIVYSYWCSPSLQKMYGCLAVSIRKFQIYEILPRYKNKLNNQQNVYFTVIQLMCRNYVQYELKRDLQQYVGAGHISGAPDTGRLKSTASN